jgi:hypothetical protein
MFDTFIEWNLGKEYLDVVPRYVVTTDEPEDLVAVGNFLTANFDRLSLEQKNACARRLNIPEFVKGQEVANQPAESPVTFRRAGEPRRAREA